MVGRVAGLRDVALTVVDELEHEGADQTPAVVLDELGRGQPGVEENLLSLGESHARRITQKSLGKGGRMSFEDLTWPNAEFTGKYVSAIKPIIRNCGKQVRRILAARGHCGTADRVRHQASCRSRP